MWINWTKLVKSYFELADGWLEHTDLPLSWWRYLTIELTRQSSLNQASLWTNFTRYPSFIWTKWIINSKQEASYLYYENFIFQCDFCKIVLILVCSYLSLCLKLKNHACRHTNLVSESFWEVFYVRIREKIWYRIKGKSCIKLLFLFCECRWILVNNLQQAAFLLTFLFQNLQRFTRKGKEEFPRFLF